MKKLKFLQSSKDLLSRSFNSSKCKTALKLAGSRVKLLKNIKEGLVKHMRREIAQLLESGDDRTARIRVEHVIREEKMMAAYDLIELYCELVATRLPIIETQKTCPIDLKEAITSIAFASPRCGDVPELLDARKQFTTKYGKEFTERAIELRPACGVSLLLVEKLSAAAPDIQTKLKVLQGIAEEHNVKWDFVEEKDTVASDLLKGPSTPRKEKEVVVEASHYESPHVQAPSSNYMSGSHSKIPEKLTARQTSGVSTTYQPRESPRGDERSHGERQKWNMEFKDATSAAQAAAECAEQASMAARAAAILSTRESMSRQYSSGSNKSDGYSSKFSSSQVSRKNSLEGEDSRGEINIKKPSLKHNTNNSLNPENRNSRYHTSVVFDKSDSEGDDHGFDAHPIYDDDSLIHRSKKNSSTDYSEKSTPRRPVIFDDSGGPASGSDESSERHSPKSEGLNFGNLTGGFRHKPTYLKNHFVGSPLLKDKTEETLQPTFPPHNESPKRTTMLDRRTSIKKPELHSNSDSDSSEEEGSSYSGYKKEMYRKKLSLRPSNPIFGSVSDFDDNDTLQEFPSREKHTLRGISRRTEASPTGTMKSEVLNSDSQNMNSNHQRTSSHDNNFESPRKASHVHPKLPDYDTFVKSFQRRRS